MRSVCLKEALPAKAFFKKAESSAPDQVKVEIQFDVYMQGQITGNIIHLENGKFIASYKWEEY